MRTNLFFLIVFSIISKPVFTQDTRSVIIYSGDSTIRVTILNNDPGIKAKVDKHYYWCSSETIFMNMGGYSGNLLHGEYSVFNRKKQLVSSGNFNNGLMDGTWKFWDTNGNIIKILSYKAGNLHGRSYFYTPGKDQYIVRNYKKGNLAKEWEELSGNRINPIAKNDSCQEESKSKRKIISFKSQNTPAPLSVEDNN